MKYSRAKSHYKKTRKPRISPALHLVVLLADKNKNMKVLTKNEVLQYFTKWSYYKKNPTNKEKDLDVLKQLPTDYYYNITFTEKGKNQPFPTQILFREQYIKPLYITLTKETLRKK